MQFKIQLISNIIERSPFLDYILFLSLHQSILQFASLWKIYK